MDRTRAVLHGLLFGRYAASSSPKPRRSPPAPPAATAATARRKTARTPAVGTVTGPGGTSGTCPRQRTAQRAVFGNLHSRRLAAPTPRAITKATSAPTAPTSGNTARRPQFQEEAPCG